MKNVKSLLVAGVLTLALATAHTAQAVTATASASADIIAPISLIQVDGATLQFGQIVPMDGGTVTIAPDSGRSSTGVEVVPSSTAKAAAFEVGGNAGNTFGITLPASATISSGDNDMTVDAFTSDPSGTGTLDGTGKKALHVGGTLHVGANQPTGLYTGSFTITVAYN